MCAAWFRMPALLSAFCLFLTGCTEHVLPSFDGGVLNPDIRYLRAGEIMDSVKCALVAFMSEREKMLMEKRATHGPEREAFAKIETRLGKDNVYSPYELNRPKSLYSLEHCGPHRHWDYNWSDEWGVLRKDKGCVENRCDEAVGGPNMGASVWDYQTPIKNDRPKVKGCVPVPDYSRFALDPNQSASIQLTLLASFCLLGCRPAEML